MTEAAKILVLTDLHLRGAGKTIIGLDPVARTRAVLGAALSDHPDAKMLILMGDLTHSGRPEEYAALKGLLSDCPIPILPMLGNHDDRTAFRAAFDDAPATDHGHVQAILDLPHHRIITLDSHQRDALPHHAGALCDDRLAWLDAALAGAGGRTPLVFIHHPPMDIGLPGMDNIRLTNGPDLLQRLQGNGAYLFCGHIHRTISGQAAGVPYAIFKSPCHQAPLDLTAADSTLSIDEPGAYGVILLSKGAVTVHSQDVGLGTVAVSGSDALPET